jgi:hypothetical protein
MAMPARDSGVVEEASVHERLGIDGTKRPNII